MVMGGVWCTGAAQCRPFGLLQTPFFLCYYVLIDLLQLPPSYQGSNYVVVIVDMFSRYVILALIKEKTARVVALTIVSSLICEHTCSSGFFERQRSRV